MAEFSESVRRPELKELDRCQHWQLHPGSPQPSMGTLHPKLLRGAMMVHFHASTSRVRLQLSDTYRGHDIRLEPKDPALLEHKPSSPPGLDELACVKSEELQPEQELWLSLLKGAEQVLRHVLVMG